MTKYSIQALDLEDSTDLWGWTERCNNKILGLMPTQDAWYQFGPDEENIVEDSPYEYGPKKIVKSRLPVATNPFYASTEGGYAIFGCIEKGKYIPTNGVTRHITNSIADTLNEHGANCEAFPPGILTENGKTGFTIYSETTDDCHRFAATLNLDTSFVDTQSGICSQGGQGSFDVNKNNKTVLKNCITDLSIRGVTIEEMSEEEVEETLEKL